MGVFHLMRTLTQPCFFVRQTYGTLRVSALRLMSVFFQVSSNTPGGAEK